MPSGTTTPLFNSSEVASLFITGDADDDTITNETNLFCYIEGGDGDSAQNQRLSIQRAEQYWT